MNKPETYIPKQNHFNRHFVDVCIDEKKAVIYQASKIVRDFYEKTQHMSLNLLNVLIAKENEQVCSILFETKKMKAFR